MMKIDFDVCVCCWIQAFDKFGIDSDLTSVKSLSSFLPPAQFTEVSDDLF